MANEQITKTELRTEIRWKTLDGKLTVGVNIFDNYGTCVIEAVKDGEPISETFWGLHKPAPDQIKKYPGLVSVLGGLAIYDKDRHDLICAELAAMSDQIDNHPKYRMQKLKEKREELERDVEIFLDCAYEAHVNNIEHMSEHGFSDKNSAAQFDHCEAKTEKARKELAEFDAANPDVLAAIAAAKKEQTERFLACD